MGMIAVIDYGMGNLRSVSKALEAVGAKVEVTDDASKIENADALVLPGVGAFCHGMENLKKIEIIPSILKSVKEGKPLLGICLGLQLLFTKSYEHGKHDGLGIIEGSVKKFDFTNKDLKIPHMGWNQISIKKQDNIFKDVPDNSYFYFVHSYYVEPEDKSRILASTKYGLKFTSAVIKNNIFGVQFHPEKSSDLGLKILENFVGLC